MTFNDKLREGEDLPGNPPPSYDLIIMWLDQARKDIQILQDQNATLERENRLLRETVELYNDRIMEDTRRW